MKNKVLITGANGFIGRNAFEFFSQREDFEVWGTYHTKKSFDHPRLLQADLTRKEDVVRVCKDVDLIIHAAAVTSGAKDIISRPYIHVTDNTIMNTLLLQAAFDYSVPRFIFFSCTVMYPMDKDHPLTEGDVDLIGGLHKNYFPGAWMKTYAEKLCEFYATLGRTRFTVLRHSNIYGPYDSFDPDKAHVYSATINKVMNATESITVWGDGSERRDFLFIDDLVDCVNVALEKQTSPFEIFNIGSGTSLSVRELVELMISVSGKNLRIEYDITKPTIKSSLALDISKAARLLTWQPKTRLREGIKKTIAWYANHVQSNSRHS